MIATQLDTHLRMRASLVGILDLDPEGVATRIVETDWEIDRLTSLLEAEAPAASTAASPRPIETVRIGLRAA